MNNNYTLALLSFLVGKEMHSMKMISDDEYMKVLNDLDDILIEVAETSKEKL